MPTAAAPDLQAAFDHHKAGRLPEAEAAYRMVLGRAPGYPAAVHGLGVLHHVGGRNQEAELLLRQAVSGAPKVAEFRANLAVVLGAMGRHRDAADELHAALALRPDYAEGWCNLGVALERCNQPDQAAEAYAKAIALRPEYAQAHNFLGNALRRMGRLREAEASHNEALRLDEQSPGAWANLAATLSGQGRLKEVIAARRKVSELRPKSASAASALLATMHYDGTYSPQDLLAEARTWARQHAARFAEGASSFDNDPDPRRPLKIGFLSGNLTAHPEGRLLRPMLSHLDRESFSTFVYSSVGRGDGVTNTLRQLCDTWREVGAMRDAELARGIRSDGVDVLVDLGGHFGNNRMQLLARQPAPVQAIHFGYPGTSGLEQVGWRISDPYADPLSETPENWPTSYTAERLVRIEGLAWCYEPPLEARAVGALPALSNGHVSFCCCNNTIKVTEQAVDLWAKILLAVPGSTLAVLAEGDKAEGTGKAKAAKSEGKPIKAEGKSGADGKAPEEQQADEAARSAEERAREDLEHRKAQERGRHLLERFAAAGVEAGRVTLAPRQPRGKYFEWIHAADIALDPFPYNGGVTSCDTLWMGVPLVSLRGRSYWARQGVALLGNVGHEQLIAETPDDYVRIAVELAGDLERLAEIRRGLRRRLAESAVCDVAGFAQKYGQALRKVWADWCGSQPKQAAEEHEPQRTETPVETGV
ncbi:MAG TPA: tetratricopeptide repeat protein [Tepidisphaeraceae bacterium]|jgi:predicted O-linked N-acetylglucosamine transferase (SPINDLY family)|nr:tetratricopeptide repeat protein [Tepidisphaeraceae bacterium]